MAILGGATKKFVESSFLIETEDCIHWPFSLDKRGYPQAQDANGFYKPHRRVCEMRHGPAPTAKYHAAHACGNRGCINKAHLSWKTPRENEQDKLLHGTYNRGPARKLDDDAVREIRRRWSRGESLLSISRDFPITHGSVRKIVYRQSYQDVA